MRYLVALICLVTTCALNPKIGYTQTFKLPKDSSSVTIPFELIRNVIVLKMEVNGKGPYRFVLDSGSSMLLITDPEIIDTLNFQIKNKIEVRGITSDTSFTAIVPEPQSFAIQGVTSDEISPGVFKEDYFGISNFAGFKIHGILGYNFFDSFPLQINFVKNEIVVYSPKKAPRFGNKRKIPLQIVNRKPYITTNIKFFDNSECNCKLIIDTGAGHALSLEKNDEITWPTIKRIEANLGTGITGLIDGEIGRISRLTLGRYHFDDIITAFPKNLLFTNLNNNRDGNLGIQVLKRFTVFFDYQKGFMALIPRENAFVPFDHELSGLEFFAEGKDYNELTISRVEPGSPADEVGLMPDDKLTKINLIQVNKMSLQKLDEILNEEEGKNVLIEVKRDNKYYQLILTLKRRI